VLTGAAPSTVDDSDAALSRSFDNPKSRTFTRPSFETTTLAGFRSRWTTPRSWAAPTPSAMGTARSSSRRSGSPLDGISSDSGRPSTSSIVRKCTSPRLALEASTAFGVARSGDREHPDRDVASQSRVVRPVDLAHASRTDGG
jgi:hypothetical protein